MPGNQLAAISFNRISKRQILRNCLLWLPIPLGACVASILLGESKVALISAIISCMLSVAFVLRWYRWGFAWDNQYVYIRKGLLGVDYYCFPIFKVQQSKFIQSFLMKRSQIATTSLVLASGAITIPFIREADAFRLIDKCLYVVESKKQSWM